MNELTDISRNRDLIGMAGEISASYVSHNEISPLELPKLIGTIFATLAELAHPTLPREELTPPVSIRRSKTADYLICLEDGKKFTSLKRHLMTSYGLTPDQYREKWGLPADYPMVAPNYSTKRSSLAKASGLGRAGAPRKKAKKARPDVVTTIGE